MCTNDVTRATAEGMSRPTPDRRRTANEWANAVENLYGEIAVISHLSHFLLSNLERDFDSQRARSSDEHTITFSFSKNGVNSLTWLAGEVWVKADELKKTIAAHQAAADRDADAEVSA